MKNNKIKNMAISDNDEDVHSFDDIIKGFQYAVNSAQEMLVAHHLFLDIPYHRDMECP